MKCSPYCTKIIAQFFLTKKGHFGGVQNVTARDCLFGQKKIMPLLKIGQKIFVNQVPQHLHILGAF